MTPSLRAVAAPLLVAGATTALVFAAGLVSGRTLFGAPPVVAQPVAAPPSPAPLADSCGLPAGISFELLDLADRALALRRGFLCADLQAGRIALDEYRTRLELLERAPARADLTSLDLGLEIVWASTVRAFSSQYSDSDWSAARVLGPPDVPDGGGDHPNAWASASADDRVEFIEVGFDRPRRISGVDIHENHNAGAITRIELIDIDGIRTVAFHDKAQPRPSPYLGGTYLACTAKPIAAVRVTLDSSAVPDWNEIDAIGVRPCR